LTLHGAFQPLLVRVLHQFDFALLDDMSAERELKRFMKRL